MNRIAKTLTRLAEQNKKALVTYIVNGDPRPDVTFPAMHALVAAGADVIELGVPFSDPMAEGPVIQRGHERALKHHTSLRGTFALVSEFRKTNSETPVVIMGYANPIERMGYQVCAETAAEAGVDGVLTVDLPAEEANEHTKLLKQHGLENIFLVAPTTTDKRIEDVAALAGGFIYYVSLKGVTGAGHLDIPSVVEGIARVRQHSTLPALVGFGIKDADSARQVGEVSDGVVVGSVLVNEMGSDPGADPDTICEKLKAIVQPMRDALDDIHE